MCVCVCVCVCVRATELIKLTTKITLTRIIRPSHCFGDSVKTSITKLLKNIDCGYSLEPPRRSGSNEYPQSMF